MSSLETRRYGKSVEWRNTKFRLLLLTVILYLTASWMPGLCWVLQTTLGGRYYMSLLLRELCNSCYYLGPVLLVVPPTQPIPTGLNSDALTKENSWGCIWEQQRRILESSISLPSRGGDTSHYRWGLAAFQRKAGWVNTVGPGGGLWLIIPYIMGLSRGQFCPPRDIWQWSETLGYHSLAMGAGMSVILASSGERQGWS